MLVDPWATLVTKPLLLTLATVASLPHQQAHDGWGHLHRGHRSRYNRDGSRIRASGGVAVAVGDDLETAGIRRRLVTRVVATAMRVRIRDATTSYTPAYINGGGIAGGRKGHRHQLSGAVGWERNGPGSNLQAERRIGISDRNSYRLLAAEGRESHDQPRIFQHGQPARQLVHERHDRISCARAFGEQQRVPPDLMGFSARTSRM